ncbi:MAG: peptide deformylase [Elusimicrobia bacterium RIFOXYA2_FULL_39_19]|nr:MAG: peptide deformylase [Elusimicrobia bacterium RIFOXYA2_FULL_39_19]
MAILEIKKYPDPILKKKTKLVRSINADIKNVIRDMFETMRKANGVGLAANQVGLPLKIVVISIPKETSQPDNYVLINPKIVQKKGKMIDDEGCLSFPGLYVQLKRHKYIKVKALDEKGKIYEIEGINLLSKALQHEIDHLEGKSFIDRLPILLRLKAKREIKRRIKAGTW